MANWLKGIQGAMSFSNTNSILKKKSKYGYKCDFLKIFNYKITGPIPAKLGLKYFLVKVIQANVPKCKISLWILSLL